MIVCEGFGPLSKSFLLTLTCLEMGAVSRYEYFTLT